MLPWLNSFSVPSFHPSSNEEGHTQPPFMGEYNKMGLGKSLRDFLHLKGKLPPEVKGEAYELYRMGADIPEIENTIELRTRGN